MNPDKINKFLLLPGAKHSKEFFDVGYKVGDYELLFDDIALGFDMKKAVDFRQNPNGNEGFSIFMKLGVIKNETFVLHGSEKTLIVSQNLQVHTEIE